MIYIFAVAFNMGWGPVCKCNAMLNAVTLPQNTRFAVANPGIRSY